MANTSPGERVLTTHTERIGLSTLLQVAQMEALSVRFDLGGLASVWVSRGTVVDAAYRDWQGKDALLEMFVDPPMGAVVAFAEERADTTSLGLTPSLILAGSRRADEWARLGSMVFVRCGAKAPELTRSSGRLWSALDGRSAIFELLEALPVPRHAAAAWVAAWLEGRMVRSAAPSKPQPVRRTRGVVARAPDSDRAFRNYMHIGRFLAKLGEYVEAAEAFARAVQLRPEDVVARRQLNEAEAHADRGLVGLR